LLIDINEIIINKRIRKNTGDLTSLMESMNKFGQLHPVILNKKHELISGFRRIQSAKKLNWKTITAAVVDVKSEADKLAIELDENLRRKDFTEEEKIEALKKLDKLNRPSIFWLFGMWIKELFQKIFRVKK